MPLTQLNVGPPSNASFATGSVPGQLGGKQADGIIAQLHGKYYTQNYNGNVYYVSNAAAGAAFSIFSNTTFIGLLVWNPQGSGKNLSIIRASFGINLIGATALTGMGYSWLVNAGAGVATAAPFTAFAGTTIRGSCILGAPGQGNSVALVATTATLTTAFTWGRPATWSTSTGIVGTVLGQMLYEDLDGTMVVPPGVALALTSNILGGVTGTGGFIWEETPL